MRTGLSALLDKSEAWVVGSHCALGRTHALHVSCPCYPGVSQFCLMYLVMASQLGPAGEDL